MKNKDLGKLFEGFFYLIVFFLLVWTATLDYNLIARLVPNQRFLPAFGLVLFDGGLISWLMIFIYRARGSLQRLLAFVMTLISLLGIGIFTAISLMLEAQQIITFVNVETLPNITVIAIGIQTFLFVASTVGYHLSDPDIMERNALQAIEDEILGEALEQFEKRAPSVAKRLVSEMAEMMLKGLTERVAIRIGEEDEYEYEVVKHKKGYVAKKQRTRARRRKARQRKAATTTPKPSRQSAPKQQEEGGEEW